MSATLANPFSPALLTFTLRRLTGQLGGTLTVVGDPSVGGCQVSSTTWSDATILAAYNSLPWTPYHPGAPAPSALTRSVPAFSPQAYGSVGAAYAAASAAGGGILFVPPGIWPLNDLIWTDPRVELQGAGKTSTILQASQACASVLTIDIGPAGGGKFSDFTVDGNNLATNPIYQTITAETSVNTSFVRVLAKNAPAGQYQWVNDGCEDCTYIDCETPADETNPLQVPRSFSWNIPQGACSVLGCKFFGRNLVNAQLLTVEGGVAGPYYFSAGTVRQVLALRGVYVYDGGVDNETCIDTSGVLSNVDAEACVFICNEAATIVNGSIPAGVTIQLKNCSYVQGSQSDPFALVTASGAGSVVIEGGSVNSFSAGTTINAFDAVGGATTVFTMPVFCDAAQGVMNPAGAVIRTTSSTLDDGTGNLQTGGSLQAGGAGVKLTNAGQVQFLNVGGGSLYSGSGAPAAGLGADGDYYFRTDTPGVANQRIYVNSAGAWTGIV